MEIVSENFDQFAKLIEDAVVLLDENGVVVQANDKAFDLLGHHIAGYPLEWFLRHPDFMQALDVARHGGEISDLNYTRMEQVRREFHIRLAPFGRDHVILLVSDATMQFSVDRIRSDFVANVSHELRSPLTALSGFVETLQDGAIDDREARHTMLAIMKSESERMQRLIDDLLSLSRVEAEEHRKPTDPVDIVNVLSDTMSVLSQQAKQANMTLRLEDWLDDEGALILVRGAVDELRQVFQNLVENALRYGHRGSEVKLVLGPGRTTHGEMRKDLLRAQIVNQGDTIAPEHLARLTERFYRIDKGRSRQMGGTGLGLAIVKHIINRHRGRLRVTSENGETVFSVTLRRFINTKDDKPPHITKL